MAIKDLGPVTAYAYAVQGGYTGTEQEFTEALGQAGITLAELEGLRAVATTLAEGQQATASYANGVLTLGIPRGATGSTGAKGDKGDTGETGNGIESIVLTSTVGSVKTYTITFTDGTTTTFEVKDGEVTEELLEEILEEYAKNNGYYDEFTAGSAEQLLSTQFVEDSVPYKFRTSGGSKDIGNREYDEIVGGSIVWNQHGNNRLTSVSKDGLTFTLNDDGTITVNGTASADGWNRVGEWGTLNTDVRNTGHVYFFHCVPNGSSSTTFYYQVAILYWTSLYTDKIWKGNGTSNVSDYSFRFYYKEGTVFNNLKIACQCFDLTLMFGSTVADYIYSLEQAQSGKGVAFFKNLFPNDYYQYNAGELLSVEGLQSHDTVGFNQWDEEWEVGGIDANGVAVSSSTQFRSKNFIPVLGGQTYYIKSPFASGIGIFQYDGDRNYITRGFIANATVTLNENTRYIKFRTPDGYTTYNNDICINLSWSGWRNGEYEPYKKHSYALDSSLTLRGIPKLNAQNELYFDGDVYPHDGNVQRMLSAVVLSGSEEWSWSAGNGVAITQVRGLKIIDAISQAYQLTFNNNSKLADVPWSKRLTVDGALGIYFGKPYIYVKLSSITSAEDAKAFFTSNPTTVIYALQTPTEETAEPYASPQNVDDFGTEEYISGNVVPVGHNTQYPANLRDKLQHLPNLADNDGYYMISQQNKQMSLELFRIPKAPTTDGTYTLKATVSGGTPTYTWESEETE